MKSLSKQAGVAIRCLLVALLVFTMVPALAFAIEGEQLITEEETNNTLVEPEDGTLEENSSTNNEEPSLEDQTDTSEGEFLEDTTEQFVATLGVEEEPEELTTLEAAPELPTGWALAADEAEITAALSDPDISTIVLTSATYTLSKALNITRDITFATYKTASESTIPVAMLSSAAGARHLVVNGGSTLTISGLYYDADTVDLSVEERWTNLGSELRNIVFDGASTSGGVLINVTGGYEINGATIQNCNQSDKGGAVMTAFSVGADVTVRNCAIQNNTAQSNGGGIYVYEDLFIYNSSVSGNTSAGNVGGGIFAGSITGDQLTLTNNTAALQGGGALSYTGNITLSNSTVSNNSGKWGGGLYTDGGRDIILTNVDLIGNTGTDSNSAGGGIHTKGDGSDVVINGVSRIEENNGGGIVLNSGSASSITINASGNYGNGFSVTVRNNTGPGLSAGGAVTVTASASAAPVSIDNNSLRGVHAGGDLTLEAQSVNNIIISYNNTSNATNFAGAYGGGNISINNCLFEGNETAAWGGALGTQSSEIDFVVKNSVFRNNVCGNSGGSAGGAFGGAISSWSNKSFTAENCLFEGNSAGTNGTAAAVQVSPNAENTFTNCTFTNNVAKGNVAGAVRTWRMPTSTSVIGTTTFAGCTFSENQASWGGAIGANNEVNLVVNNCAFSGNTALVSGGAIYSTNSEATLTVNGSTFENNTASGYYGGAVYMSSTTVNSESVSVATINNSDFINNSAAGGGAIYTNSTALSSVELNLSNSRIVGNTSKGNGGGVRANISATVNISSTVFEGNTATSNGGAIAGGSQTFVNVTKSSFQSNTSQQDGGAVYLSRLLALTVSGSSFTNNTAQSTYTGYAEDLDTDADGEIDSVSHSKNIKSTTYSSAHKSLYSNDNVNYTPVKGVYDYTVRFLDWDGTVLKTQVVKQGGSATPPANPARNGWNFLGWVGTYTNISSNQDVYASYEEQPYVPPVIIDPEEPTIDDPDDPIEEEEEPQEEVDRPVAVPVQTPSTTTPTPTPDEPVELTLEEAAEQAGIPSFIVPLAAPEGYLAWSLANLILVVISVLLTAAFALARLNLFKKKPTAARNDESSSSAAKKPRGRKLWIIGAAVFALAGLIVFVITQDMSLPLVWVDGWTLLIGILALVAVALGVVSLGRKKQQSTEDTSVNATA